MNDQYIVDLLFSDFTSRILNSSPKIQALYSTEYLLNQWITSNPYRDHLAKNFDDKIFFFEPINKFYDLLWIKRLAFRELLRFTTIPIISPVNAEDAEAKLAAYYVKDIEQHNSTEFEAIVEDLMLVRLAEPQRKIAAPSQADCFIKEILTL